MPQRPMPQRLGVSHRRSLVLTGAAAMGPVAIALAGCGASATDASTVTVERQAASAMPDTKACPEQSPSFTYRSKIVNQLPSPIMLEAGQYDCNDWSGVSTPGQVFTGKIIQPGETMSFALEPRKNVNRAWTMEFVGVSGSPSYGTARLSINVIAHNDQIEVAGSTRVYGRKPFNSKLCHLLPMEQTGAPRTPEAKWPELFTRVSLGVISYGGRMTLANMCGDVAIAP